MRTTHSPEDQGSDTPDGTLDLPELSPPKWNRHGAAVAGASWFRIARRMPALVAQAAVLAWQSGRRDVVTTVLFNIGSGAATAWALIATTSALTELFAEVPTPDRVSAALPSRSCGAAAAPWPAAPRPA